MAVTKDDVQHVALLARLEFDDEELDTLTREMNEILGYVKKLRGLSTEGVVPLFRTLGRENVFRADEVGPMLSLEEALANAPDEEDGQFRVPGFLPGD